MILQTLSSRLYKQQQQFQVTPLDFLSTGVPVSNSFSPFSVDDTRSEVATEPSTAQLTLLIHILLWLTLTVSPRYYLPMSPADPVVPRVWFTALILLIIIYQSLRLHPIRTTLRSSRMLRMTLSHGHRTPVNQLTVHPAMTEFISQRLPELEPA